MNIEVFKWTPRVFGMLVGGCMLLIALPSCKTGGELPDKSATPSVSVMPSKIVPTSSPPVPSVSPGSKNKVPNVTGLKCGAARQRLNAFGFYAVYLVSLDAKIRFIEQEMVWTAIGQSPKAGTMHDLTYVVSVDCQWDGAGIQSPPAEPVR